MRLDRKKNAAMGALSGIINKMIVTLLPFIMRTTMIYIMGTQYLGLSSLFSSILNVLSLAELGFGSALVYSMYKPIANNDTDLICALLNMYKKIYRIIGGIICIAGVAVLPFLNYLISGKVPDDINVYILYLIYLFNTSITYFLFAYKNSLLDAFQRNDISNNVNTILTTVEYFIQIIFIFIFKNYYLYVFVFPVFTILGNLVRARIVSRMYPQYVCRGKVENRLERKIYLNTGALAIHKIGNTISTSIDSMVVSALLGLTAVAIFGNYKYIITTVMAIIGIVYSSMTAGIGNKIQLESVESNYNDFMSLTLINQLIISWCTSCMLCLYQVFMNIWVGNKYLLGFDVVIAFSAYFYIYQSRKIVLLYKDAAGLWNADKFKPIIGAGVNVLLNITLSNLLGIKGVVLSSVVSFLMIEEPWETYVLFRDYFKRSTKEYFLQLLISFLIFIPICAITYWLCILVKFNLYGEFILKIVICLIVPSSLLFFCYRKNPYLQRFKNMVNKVLK